MQMQKHKHLGEPEHNPLFNILENFFQFHVVSISQRYTEKKIHLQQCAGYFPFVEKFQTYVEKDFHHVNVSELRRGGYVENCYKSAWHFVLRPSPNDRWDDWKNRIHFAETYNKQKDAIVEAAATRSEKLQAHTACEFRWDLDQEDAKALCEKKCSIFCFFDGYLIPMDVDILFPFSFLLSSYCFSKQTELF